MRTIIQSVCERKMIGGQEPYPELCQTFKMEYFRALSFNRG